MSKQASVLSAGLVNYLQALDKTRIRLEAAFSGNHIGKRDLERVYEGLYVNAVSSFENFLEELFFGLLLGNLQVSRQVKPRASFPSVQAARKIALGNQPFLKWLPYDYTLETADKFLYNSFPFSRLTETDKGLLKKIVCIRNATAHKSRSALEKFERTVIASLSLTRSEKSPAGFLRGTFRIGPIQTRYEAQMISLARMAQILAK